MSAEPLTLNQRAAISCAKEALQRESQAAADLADHVKEARAYGVPILYLADALGVSRSRIRVLSRPAREHQQ